ncbi:hypothetical protein CDEST_15402 [Colletotrichum destructivum]|uniref:Integral membrane protein n=1 Tax=Colletotrichum destructivum TaxID=34406 RepID=A0AAX4J478_9PEZI|nr:hypothetical protein CDEST_15402 [Colletotrichum destructivum]
MQFLNVFNAIIWCGFLAFFLSSVNPGWDTGQNCSMLNITTAEIAKNISDTFDILDKDQAQRRITVPSQISEPLKSVATKVEGHVATAVASAKQAISTPLTNVWKEIQPKFLDDLTRWRNTVPVYCCLQTRGVWQLGYPDSTTKLVPSQDFNMVEAFQIKELSELFSAAHKIVPGLPDSLASDLGNVDFGVVDRIVVVIYGLLLALLVGTFVTIVVSIFLPQTGLFCCIPRMAINLLLLLLWFMALACMSVSLAVTHVSSGLLSILDLGITSQAGTTLWLSVAAAVWLSLWFVLNFLKSICL